MTSDNHVKNYDSLLEQKEVAFYAASVTAWYTTRFERDKHLLALSSLAIGIIVTILTTVGAQDKLSFWLFGASLLAFLISIGVVLAIFRRNSTYLEEMLLQDKETDSTLEWWDDIAIFAFLVGVVICIFVALSTGIQTMDNKGGSCVEKQEFQRK